MRKKQAREMPPDLEEVGVRFEHWRRTRLKLGPIPQELWQAAVSLAQKYGIGPVASALHLNHSVLRERATQGAALALPDTRDQPSNEKTHFLPLPSLSLFSPPSSQESIIELKDAEGATLTLRLPSEMPLDLLALVQAFWSR
jgi:hypothetical protein